MADLLKDNKRLMAEFDVSKNPEIDINTITLGSNKKVWWKCANGHSFAQTVEKRYLRGYNCPYCSGKKVLVGFNDLGTVAPELAKDWDYDKNGEITPQSLTLHSNKKVWWKCHNCGFTWCTQVNTRANGRGCKRCSEEQRVKSFREHYLKRGENDLATVRPDLLSEWDYAKNTEISPSDFTCYSNEKVWWKCSVCGHSWKATIGNRVNRNSGCPKCKRVFRTSFPEQALLFYIQQVFPSAENSYTDIFGNSGRELDIYIPEEKIGIEYDGSAWHSDNRARRVGIEKYKVCKENGIKLIRVSELPEETDDCDFYIFRDGNTSSSLDATIEKVMDFISGRRIDVDSERDRDVITSRYFRIVKSQSISAKCPDVAIEWDYEKNGDITPEMVRYSTANKYWWKCEKGHSYRMSPLNRCVHNSGCPICSGRVILSGYNDLQTKFPEVAKEWDYEKNYPIKAESVSPGSQTKYWWICKEGHSYQAKPDNRCYGGSGCPYCSGKKVQRGFNDLSTTNPDVLSRWDYKKNGDLTPEMVSAGSNKKVWWVCPCGHEYEKGIASFVRYPNCPICSGRLLEVGINDLKTTHPAMADQWDYDKNDITPDSITRTSDRKVWWKCRVCGTEWQQKVNVRILSGSGCPNCGYKIKLGETRRKNKRK